MSLIKLCNVKKGFGKKTPALRGIDLEIADGEIVAVIGPSGSGKSTLLHCMAGILKTDSGEVFFNEENLSKWNDKKRAALRRTQFGFVFQFSQLVPELTALDNVALPLLINGVKKAAAYTEARQWLNKLKLEQIANQTPGQLSGGQAQRVAIARAMIIKPRVLFADEPTGSLDSLNSEKIMELLIKTAKEQAMTVVLITHEASIAAYADRTITVQDGIIMGAEKCN